MQKIYHSLRRSFIILLHWEYWPSWAIYFPAGIYYVWLSLRARSPYFFSAANPGIENGGMFFESKWTIFQNMPEDLYPATILVEEQELLEDIGQRLKEHHLSYPFIAKPDRGERGWGVQKIHDLHELYHYRQRVKVPFLLQAYVDLPAEFSIFYYRHPDAMKGTITSVTRKELLTVTGNGHDTVRQLILRDDRAFLQQEALFANDRLPLDTVLPEGVQQLLVPYGNHCRGARFIDETHLADAALTEVFDGMADRINGFYFGRFDLRARSLEDLKRGEHFSIVELNGAGAEPAHIYMPGFSYWKAQRVIARHFYLMWTIAMYFKQQHPFMSAARYRQLKAMEKAYKTKVA